MTRGMANERIKEPLLYLQLGRRHYLSATVPAIAS
jgi:hypothetical protein